MFDTQRRKWSRIRNKNMETAPLLCKWTENTKRTFRRLAKMQLKTELKSLSSIHSQKCSKTCITEFWLNSMYFFCISDVFETPMRSEWCYESQQLPDSHRNQVNFTVIADFMHSLHQHVENDLAARRRERTSFVQQRENRAHAKLGDCSKAGVVVLDERY